MKQTKKSLLFSALALVLSVSMLIGSTFAWFTDSVTSFANKIQSGTLKVDLELLDKETGEWNSLKATQAPIFDYDKWEPGYVDTKILKVENEGNLALKWVAKFYSEKQLSILADVIDVYVRPSDSEIGYPANRSLEGYTCVGSLKTFINSIEETTQGTLEAKEAAYLGIALKMREEAGNEYQNLSLGGAFDIRVFATQHTSESDSFGNMYDILADESIVAADSKKLEQGEDAIEYDLTAKGVTIANVDVPAAAVLDPSKPVTIIFDGIDPEKTIEVGKNTKAYAFDISVTNINKNLIGNQLIKVTVAAPKGLPELKAYHNGVLIPDAVYDEVAGTITFKTASFSPFAFTYTEVEANDLSTLRTQVAQNNRLIKLTADLKIDLSKGSADRSGDHVLKSGSSTYYNAVNINSQNIAIDLNGHKITVSCDNGPKGNSDVGALFFVDSGGSLNIIDDAGGGYIKMESSIYAVWAPFNDGESYLDIYGGVFIADSYAGDPVGTPVDSQGNYDPVNGTMKNENSNRALIYAGFGGNINVYGGYFLYNNTPNDSKDRNNGAFNAKDFYSEEDAAANGPLITIHEGVYLSNKEYRQNPANTSQPNGDYDNFSVVLSQYGKVSETTVTETIKIVEDGKEKEITLNWYKVVPNYAYKVTFMNSAGNETLYTHYVMSNDSDVNIKKGEEIYDKAVEALINSDSSYTNDFGGWFTAGSQNITTISKGNKKDYVLYPSYTNKITVRFVDQHGKIVYEETIKQGGSITSEPNVPELDDFEGDWEENWKTKIKNAKNDITIYPVYEYNGNLSLKPVDEDGDGTTDYYQVESVSNLDETVRVPGYVNGKPVKIVQKLTASYWDDTKTVVLEEGIEILKSESLAGTPDLTQVTLPLTINKIEKKAFSSNVLGAGTKKISFTYNGTREDFEKITLDSGWDEGLGNGTTITCSDGSVYKLTRGGIAGLGPYTWSWSN